jgi:ElaB/YqjD/DUF883 family membrane-anchored ribosome-binding protein
MDGCRRSSMDLRAQSQDQSQSSSLTASPADVLSTAASTVHDVLSTPEQPQSEGVVKTIAKRLPRTGHASLYDAVHAAAEAADTLEQEASGLMRSKDRILGAATRYVDASPIQAVGIGFVAGWVIGRITR